jgi:ribosomal protein L37AE/L43A
MSDHDAAEVRRLITGAWLCTECLMSRTGLARLELHETLNALSAALLESFRTEVRRCDGCLAEKVVHRIGW